MLPTLTRRASSRLALINHHLSAPAPQTLPSVITAQSNATSSVSVNASSTGARMSSSTAAPAPSKPEWLIVIPDHPNVLEKRMEVRSTHFAGLKSTSKITFGGGLLASQVNPDQPGAPLQLNGSAVTVEADTREEALEFLRRDVYATSGVWDLDRAQIFAVDLSPNDPALMKNTCAD